MVTGRSMVSCALPGCVPPKISDSTSEATQAAGQTHEWNIMLGRPLPFRRAASGYRNLAHVLRHLVALLNRRALGDGGVPAFHVRILVEIDGLPFVARDPRPDRDIGNRITVGDELVAGEPAVEHP